jgi:GntR family transcriptional regulator/MocR family aminotransferase
LGEQRNFARFGYALHARPLDGDGICLDASRLNGGDLIYLMPEHHFPQGVTLKEPRRRDILEQAALYDSLVVEDDYDSEFFYDRQPLPALEASEAGRNVIYMGTFSKALFNSVRLGYIVTGARLVDELPRCIGVFQEALVV